MKKNIIFYILIVISMFIWGGSWISAKMISNKIDFDVLVFYRLFLCFLAFIPMILISKEKLRISIREFLLLLAAAATIILYNKLFFTGLATGLPGASGVLVTTTCPLFTYLISAAIKRKPISRFQLTGLIIGLAGGLILLRIWSFDIKMILSKGNLLFIFASITWGILTIMSAETQSGMSAIKYSFYLYGFSSIMQLFFSFNNGLTDIFDQDLIFWSNLLYLCLFSTSFATTFYFYASKKVGADLASSFSFIVPASVVIFSLILLKEIPHPATIAGGGLAVIAVFIINRTKSKKPD